MNCPNCQTPAQPGAVFCDTCGTALSTMPPFSPKAEAASIPAGGGLPCPQCGAQTIPGEAYCGQCGTALKQVMPTVLETPGKVSTPTSESPGAAMIVCSKCSASLPPGSVFCDSCGAAITSDLPLTQIVPPDQFMQGAAGYSQPASLTPRLVVQATNTPVNFSVTKNELVIGREDPVSGHFPDINLAPYGGEPDGVSRHHAKLIIQGGQYFIEDLQSVNFTQVNKRRVNPGYRQPLNDGDEIRFGRMVLMFYFH